MFKTTPTIPRSVLGSEAAKLVLYELISGGHLAPRVAALGRRVPAEHVDPDPIAAKNEHGKPEERYVCGGGEGVCAHWGQ